LPSFDPQQSRIVELRFFAGLTIEDTSEVLGISPATVNVTGLRTGVVVSRHDR